MGRADVRMRLAATVTGEEEVDAVRRVLQSGQLTNGPAVQAFEAKFAARHEVEHAVAMANGTVSLAAISLALGIGPGDEVVVPSFTFVSTATSALHVGAQPVFADVQPDTCNLDPRRRGEADHASHASHRGGALRRPGGRHGRVASGG